MNLNRGYCFYYAQLNQKEKKIYDAMIEGFKAYSRRIYLEESDLEESDQDLVNVLFEKVLLDHPEVFYIKGYTTTVEMPGRRRVIMPDYRFSLLDSEDFYQRIEKAAARILDKAAGLSVLEKEKLIHDYIVNNVEYVDAGYCHEMAGVFLYGRGVCEGISKAFKYLCDRLGIVSGIVVGDIKDSTGGHAWNMIWLDDRWYMMDVTFDYCCSKQAGEVRYDYFNVARQELTDRTITYPVPSCGKSFGYYRYKGMYACNRTELRQLISRNRSNTFSIQIADQGCSEEQMQEMIANSVNESFRGLNYASMTIVPNYVMNVYTISLKGRR